LARSGDLAYYDNDGYIYVVDRLKDVIKYKNEKIMPSEIEAIVRTHPCVVDCAVIGRPGEWGACDSSMCNRTGA